MFMELIAAHAVDPMSECPCGRDDHRRTNCPDDFPAGGVIRGDMPSKAPSVNHLIKKSINGKRITLYRIRPDGKPHYRGLPGVVVDVDSDYHAAMEAYRSIKGRYSNTMSRLASWRDDLNAPDQCDIGRKVP